MASKPFYKVCARRALLKDHECGANPLNGQLIEWEHAIIFAGKQLNEEWAIVPICYYSHRGGGLVKEINVWIALNRATDAELEAISKATDYKHERNRLNKIYGMPKLQNTNAPKR